MKTKTKREKTTKMTKKQMMELIKEKGVSYKKLRAKLAGVTCPVEINHVMVWRHAMLEGNVAMFVWDILRHVDDIIYIEDDETDLFYMSRGLPMIDKNGTRLATMINEEDKTDVDFICDFRYTFPDAVNVDFVQNYFNTDEGFALD